MSAQVSDHLKNRVCRYTDHFCMFATLSKQEWWYAVKVLSLSNMTGTIVHKKLDLSIVDKRDISAGRKGRSWRLFFLKCLGWCTSGISFVKGFELQTIFSSQWPFLLLRKCCQESYEQKQGCNPHAPKMYSLLRKISSRGMKERNRAETEGLRLPAPHVWQWSLPGWVGLPRYCQKL